MENFIKNLILSEGADVCGIGSIDRFSDAPKGFSPLDIWSDCKSVISLGVAIPKGLTQVSSRLIYGHFNGDICNVVDKIESKVAKFIEQKYDCVCVPIPCDGPYEYWDEENLIGRGLISMKHTAIACGLGSMGKNSLLVNPKFGNLLTVGAIFTNLELQPDPICKDLCLPNCHKCLDACPVQAIKDKSVNQKLCRTNSFGQTKRGFGTIECNKCRVVCPLRFGVKNYK
ncbi:MAG: hypothetical protein MJ211_05415 [Bacteroidales bacterium]|nr:hypothetical protein [Bacteroidales bacterium]